MIDHDIGKQTVLIIEKEVTSRQFLQKHLESFALDAAAAENGHDGIAVWKNDPFIRIVVIDLTTPESGGFDAIREIRKEPQRETHITVMAMQDNNNVLARAISLGADDFLYKPIDRNHLALRMDAAKNLLRLKDQNKLILKMAELAAGRSGEVDDHLKRTSGYCQLIAKDLRINNPELGVTKEIVEDIGHISVFYDIGKIGIPDGLLNKRGQYTRKEFEIIKEHTRIGAEILKRLYDETGSSFLRLGYEMALYHHERWDGKGYPGGLKGSQIPLSARIMAFADSYDAILSRRPYKDALPPSYAESVIISQKGKQFDPAIVDAYERNKDEFVEIHEKYLKQEY